MCGRHRANERFSGKGHARHLCKDCSRKPKAERERIRTLLNLGRLWEQGNISAQNIAWLESLADLPDEAIRARSNLLLRVARITPRRRKRLGYLARREPELYRELCEQGLAWPIDFEAEELDEQCLEQQLANAASPMMADGEWNESPARLSDMSDCDIPF